ncbi:MAG TPA: hypothetical protein VM686_00400 [Polyangiaceae bacterium]|nr:hypothetical protein [Polyangiaceae bacterium]
MTRLHARIALIDLTVERDADDSDPSDADLAEISRIVESLGAKPMLAKAGAKVVQLPMKRRAVGQ